MEVSAYFATTMERNGRQSEWCGCERRENEPRPHCWRGGGWERAGMGGVRAQFNKRWKETIRARISSVIFKFFLAKARKLAWH